MAGFAIRSRFAGHARRSARTRHALRLKPDHPMRAGQVLLARIGRMDEDIAELEAEGPDLQEQVDLLSAENGYFKGRVAEREREQDFGTKMLSMLKET